MKNITNKIRRTAQIGLLAGTLLAGCSKEAGLPVTQSAYENQEKRIELYEQKKQEIDTKKEQAFEQRLIGFTEYQDNIKLKFNDYLSDGKLSNSEQKDLKSDLSIALDTELPLALNAPEKYSTLKKVCGASGYYYEGEIKDSRILVNDSLVSLYKILRKNLNRIDLGVPELQKQLKKQGISCKVDKKLSLMEVLTGIGLGICLSSSVRRKE